jgi:hypothetical protein
MKKLLHFVNPVYNVNVLQSENGSVSASPISGTYGTEVTLTNTPDEGYVFDKYELTGATLYDGNKFKIKKYDVNVQGYFKIPYELWYNVATEQSIAGSSKAINLSSYIPSQSDYGYITWIFDAFIEGGSGGAAQIHLAPSSSGSYWFMYDHYIYSRPAFLLWNGHINSNWHTSEGETSNIVTLESNKAIGTTYWNSGTYGTFKIAFDRSNKMAYVYSNGHYIGYLDGFTWDPIELKYIRLVSDQGRAYEVAKYKNLKIAAFGTLSDARDWDGTIE